MKSIKEIAAELETTPQNIYLHLKQNNIPLKDLRGKKQGRTMLYDEEAEERIKGLFQSTSQKQDNKEQKTIEANETIERLKKDLEEKNKEVEAVREELAAAQVEITRLKEIEAQLIAQIRDMTETEKARLLLQAAATNRIQDASNKPGLLSRFLLRFKKEGSE